MIELSEFRRFKPMADRIRLQKTKVLIESALIVVIMIGLVLLVALQVFGALGIVVVIFGIGMLTALVSQRRHPQIPDNIYPVMQSQAPELYNILDRLASQAGLKQSPSVYLLPEGFMNAATLETTDGPVIVLTPTTVKNLDTRQLTGILAHEITHLEYRDTLLLQLTIIVHSITQSIAFVAWLMLFMFFPLLVFSEGSFPFYLLLILCAAPVASVLLQLAFSRSRELNADLGAVELTQDPTGLADALEKIDRFHSYSFSLLFPFKRPKQRNSIFRSHPNIPARISRLRKLARSF